MSPSAKPRTVLASALLAVLALAAVALVAVARGAGAPREGRAATGRGAGERTALDLRGAPPRVPGRAAAPLLAPAAAPRPPPAPAIVIDSVDVEKTSACRGEENVVTVVAHAADPAEQAWLRVEVNGVTGDRVPIRTYGLDEPGSDTVAITRRVVVRGRDGAAVEKVLPQLAVRDCVRPRELLVSHEVDPTSDGRVTFRAQLVLAPGVTGDVAGYRWTFDDGEVAETTSPEVVHDYARRPQETSATHLLVSCAAQTADGEVVVGRDPLTLENPLFPGHAGPGAPAAIVGHPAPPQPAGSATSVDVQLRTNAGASVRLARVARLRHRWSTLGTAPAQEHVAPASVLPSAELPPGGATARFTLDASDDDVVADEYVVEGTTSDGRAARGRFFVRAAGVPPRLLARLERPAFRERLVRAREVLGVARASEQDVYALEHTDAFADLPQEMP